MIRAVTFDAAGTLIGLDRSVGFHYRTVAARHGITLEESTLNRAFHQYWTDAAPPTAGQHRTWWRRLVEEVFRASGAGDVTDRLFDELYAHFAQPGVWTLQPGAADLLAQLRLRYRLAVISNFDERLPVILRNLGILQSFEHVILSSEVGFEKPDPRIFATSAARLHLQPAEIAHVGDDPIKDGKGPQSAGFQSFVLNPPKHTLAQVATWLPTLNH
jgi:putative hydrolase of the HAD superfamily